MVNHDDAVEFYAHCKIKMNVYFPNGKIDCRHCSFCRHREAFGLFQCSLTDEYIEKVQLDERGNHCPVVIDTTPF